MQDRGLASFAADLDRLSGDSKKGFSERIRAWLPPDPMSFLSELSVVTIAAIGTSTSYNDPTIYSQVCMQS